ncbi:MAG: hypothetical protein ACPG8W_08910 [Candidatus Promineifilaceae bacterium]
MFKQHTWHLVLFSLLTIVVGVSPITAKEGISGCITTDQVNTLLGAGNWGLLSGHNNGVLATHLRDQGGSGFLVAPPIIQIDNHITTYVQWETVPSTEGATVWFEAPIGTCETQTTPTFSPELEVGITHVDGEYRFTNQNYLIEGAEAIDRFGADAIFVYLTLGGDNSSTEIYPDHDGNLWPNTPPTNLTELAQTAAFRQLFTMSFSTYVLTTYSPAIPYPLEEHYSQDRFLVEQQHFYELTKYLLTTYQGQNKTFILKHWEGDSIVAAAYQNDDGEFDWNAEMSSADQQQLIRWLQARQTGVELARQEIGNANGVQVLHAVEVNRIVGIDGQKRFINGVVPYINADMVAYSAWDSILNARSATGVHHDLTSALQTIQEFTPDPLEIGRKRIFISEFGLIERNRPLTSEEVVTWCAPDCTEADFSDLIEWDGTSNLRGLSFQNSACPSMILPTGAMLDYQDRHATLRTVHGPATLPSVCGASVRLINEDSLPSQDLTPLDANDVVSWCIPTCTPANFYDLIESNGVQNMRGLVYRGQCVKFEIPLAGFSLDIGEAFRVSTPATLHKPTVVPAQCEATIRKIDPVTPPEGIHPSWRIEGTLSAADQFGLSYAFIWQLYDNECDTQQTAAGQDDPNRPSNNECRGFWLIRPDESESSAAPILKQWLDPNNVSQHNTFVPIVLR